MIINSNKSTAMIGDLNGSETTGFAQMMTKLKESFDSSGSNLHYLKDFATIMEHENTKETYNSILFEDYQDNLSLAESSNPLMQQMVANNLKRLEAICENSRVEMLQESQQTGSLKPMVGLTLPLLKLHWIKNVYKDIIPTVVSPTQTFVLGIEREYIMDQDRNKHYLPDAFYQEGLDLFASARQKLKADAIAVPCLGYDIMTASGGSIKQDDSISRQFFINSITYTSNAGEAPVDVTLDKLRIRVDQGDGTFRYPIKEAVLEGGKTKYKEVDIFQGDIDFEYGIINAGSVAGKVKTFTVDGYLSTENNLRSMSTGWDKLDRPFTIPDGEHLNTSLTEERIKDENVIYNIDSTTKVIQQMTNALGVLKDMKIQHFLDESAERLKGTDLFMETVFDCKPPVTTITPSEWNGELKVTLDKLSQKLVKVLQLENVMITVLGSQESVMLLDDINWVYGKDSQVGGCKIGYNFGVYNKMRNFFIASSDRIQDDKLRIYISPTSGDYMMYKLFEYQFVISNEYRTAENVRVPSVMAFDRYLIDELIPIQGQIEIQNNKVSSSELYK